MLWWRKQRTSDATQVRMIVGLGNPGSEYAPKRHNVGFWVIDSLAGELAIEVKKKKFGARFGESVFEGKKLILLKPWRFMNRSGQVVATAAGFYRLEARQVLVVTDDMALGPGQLRLRAKGSAGGHNGLKDVLAKLGTNEVPRLRIGIGAAGQEDAYDYVLARPRREEQGLLDEAVGKACEAIKCWLREGIETAMNEYN